MRVIETDYLVVGAGASGMAFVDALIAESDVDVVMVDRRHAPGGHWNDAYPFVRLHQPAAYYGVNSRALGTDRIDGAGLNAGFYELATGAEVVGYYRRVMDEHLLASGRVRFFGTSRHETDRSHGHRITSLLTGEQTDVRVRRAIVDASYLASSVPSTHRPSFSVDPAARFVTPNELVRLHEPASGYTVIGAGKTSMDTCVWLLQHGVPAASIRWIRPRDPWIVDRTYMQPLSLLPWFIEGLSLQLQAAAEAEDVADLFRRLETSGQFVRLDPGIEPEVYRGAILSPAEVQLLRSISDVVRRGRVVHIGTDRVTLEGGTVPTDPGQVHVDCTASGLNPAPARPIFEPGHITVQAVQYGILPFSAAMIGFVESTRDDDADKNRLCRPIPLVSEAAGWIRSTHATQRAHIGWSQEPDVAAWLDRCRLHATRGIRDHLGDPRMRAAVQRLRTNREPALANLERLMGPAGTETAA